MKIDWSSLVLGILLTVLVLVLFKKVSFYDAPQFPSSIEAITKIYSDEVERLSKEMDTQTKINPEEREKFVRELTNSMEILNNAYNMAVMASQPTTTV